MGQQRKHGCLEKTIHFPRLCYLQWSIKKQNHALKMDDSIINGAIVELEAI
jgi:hypothetical protein